MSKIDFDDVLTTLTLGRWNFLYFASLSFCGVMVPSFVFAGGYTAPNMKFECDTQFIEDPIVKEDECSYTIYDNTTTEKTNMTEQCTEWNYVDKDFSYTLTSEFDLVCDDSYLRTTYLTLYMIGNVLGSPINGFLADRFGRRRLLTFSSVISVGSVLIESFLSNINLILVSRFFTGITTSPIIQTGYIMCMEVCPPLPRTTIGLLLSLPWAFGTVWWGILGYMIRDRRWLMRASTIPAYFFFVGLVLMDESPRWNIVSGHHGTALKSLRRAARWNHSTLPEDKELLEQMEYIQRMASNTKESHGDKMNWITKIKAAVNKILILYKTPEVRKRSFLMYIVFFIAGAVFYGLSFNAVNFGLDPYLYMVVGGFTEIPAYTLPVPIVARFGRIPPTVICYFVCCVTIMALAFIPSDLKWLIITLAMLGKLCISSAYQIIYLGATEVFPTEVRMQGLGTSCFVAAIGGVASPIITDLIGNKYHWLPSIIFGGLSSIGGVAAIFIPETLNTHLPETVLQLEMNAKASKESPSDQEKQRFVELGVVQE